MGLNTFEEIKCYLQEHHNIILEQSNKSFIATYPDESFIILNTLSTLRIFAKSFIFREEREFIRYGDYDI